MFSSCKNTLYVDGELSSVEKFLKKFDLFNLGFNLISSSANSVSFETTYSAPIRLIEKESISYPNLTFTLEWSEVDFLQLCGIVVIENGTIIRNEESGETTLLAREILGDKYVDDLIVEYNFPIVSGIEKNENLLLCLKKHFNKANSQYKSAYLELLTNSNGSLFFLSDVISSLSDRLELDFEYSAYNNSRYLEDGLVRYSISFSNEN